MSFVQLPPMKPSCVTAGPHPHHGANIGAAHRTSDATSVAWTGVCTRVVLCPSIPPADRCGPHYDQDIQLPLHREPASCRPVQLAPPTTPLLPETPTDLFSTATIQIFHERDRNKTRQPATF